MKNAALESPDLVRRRRQMLARLDGICPTPEILYSDITGVSVYRRESDDVIDCNGGKAMACFVVSGTKENHIGGRKYVYTEGQCFVSSLCVPAFFHSVGASHEKPFISVGLQFEPEIIAELTKRDPIGSRMSLGLCTGLRSRSRTPLTDSRGSLSTPRTLRCCSLSCPAKSTTGS